MITNYGGVFDKRELGSNVKIYLIIWKVPLSSSPQHFLHTYLIKEQKSPCHWNHVLAFPTDETTSHHRDFVTPVSIPSITVRRYCWSVTTYLWLKNSVSILLQEKYNKSNLLDNLFRIKSIEGIQYLRNLKKYLYNSSTSVMKMENKTCEHHHLLRESVDTCNIRNQK